MNDELSFTDQVKAHDGPVIEPVVVLREEDGHMPSLLFADVDLAASPDAAMNVACVWLAANGVDEHGIFTARNEAAPAHERVQLAYWGGFDRGFVQEHHDDAQPVTVVFLPRVAIPIPADPTIAGHDGIARKDVDELGHAGGDPA